MRRLMLVISVLTFSSCFTAENDEPQPEPEPCTDEVPEVLPAPAPVAAVSCTIGLGDDAVATNIEGLLETLRTWDLDADDPGAGQLAIGGLVAGYASPSGDLRIQAFGRTAPVGGADLSSDAIFDIGSIQKNVRPIGNQFA